MPSALIDATVAAVAVPVTLKMRLGWDHALAQCPGTGAARRGRGVKLVTVHGRTRCQFYTRQRRLGRGARRQGGGLDPGGRQWRYRQPRCSAQRSRRLGGRCRDGRPGRRWGGRGFPASWPRASPAEPAGRRPPLAVQFETIATLYDAMLAHHGERIGEKHARKHVGWALDAAAASARASAATLKALRGARADGTDPAGHQAPARRCLRGARLEGRRMSLVGTRKAAPATMAPPRRCSMRCRSPCW